MSATRETAKPEPLATPPAKLAAWAVGAALLVAAPYVLNGYMLYVLTLVGIFSLVALG